MEIRGKEQMRFAYAIIDPHRAWRELRADVGLQERRNDLSTTRERQALYCFQRRLIIIRSRLPGCWRASVTERRWKHWSFC